MRTNGPWNVLSLVGLALVILVGPGCEEPVPSALLPPLPAVEARTAAICTD